MLAKVKFCGMTRPVDAALAAEIGASYVGVVFANGPRRVTAAQARTILDSAGGSVKRAGVFGTNSPDEIARRRDALNSEALKAEAALKGVTDPRADRLRSALTTAREAAAGDDAKVQTALGSLQAALNGQ